MYNNTAQLYIIYLYNCNLYEITFFRAVIFDIFQKRRFEVRDGVDLHNDCVSKGFSLNRYVTTPIVSDFIIMGMAYNMFIAVKTTEGTLGVLDENRSSVSTCA